MTTLIQQDLDKVAGLSSREAASVLGVGKSTVNKYREIARMNGGTLPLEELPVEKLPSGSSVQTRIDGSLIVESTAPTPQTKGDIDAAMAKRGFNPEEYDFTYRFSEWDAQVGGGDIVTMYAARAGASLKREVKHAGAVNADELIEEVRNWSFQPVVKDKYASIDMVTMFADPQLGKVDVNGGSSETVAQVMASYAAVVEMVKEEKPSHFLFADLGDGLENFYNTSSQRETNDLDLTSQVRLLRRLQAEGLRMIRPHVGRLTHASCTSNHGGVRIGPQQQASTESNDWGIEVSYQLEDAFSAAGSDIEFLRPVGKHSVSTFVPMDSGTKVGLSHGDQAGTQPRLGQWWMGQAFSRKNPLHDVDLLLIGHFHNQAIEEVQEGRWVIVGASSDRGSSWFTNRTGRAATSGMTTFLTAEGKFWDLRLL